MHEDLFVKFSRDFDDPIRDNGRTQMEMEVRFAFHVPTSLATVLIAAWRWESTALSAIGGHGCTKR